MDNLVPINLPVGFYRNGTPYTRKGRWEKGNLVRFHDGAQRPINGWQRRQDETFTNIAPLVADKDLEAVRDIYTWRATSQGANTVFMSNLGVYHMNAAGTVTDITPAAYSAVNSTKDAQLAASFGQNPYGVGDYGVANNLVGVAPFPPDRWYASNFGEVLLFGSINNGDMFELDLGTLTTSVVTNAPSDNADVFVTNERMVMVVGADGEPRRVRTSDVEDRNDWTPSDANQSINRVLRGRGKLLRAVPALGDVLILGEEDAHLAQYIRPPYVYDIRSIAENCGPICAQAVAHTDRFVVWWGNRTFWLYDGAVRQLDCDVIDFVYKDIDKDQVGKISCFTNTQFNEVWWLYQSQTTTTTETDKYVVWNYKTNTWLTGALNRTAGVDTGTLFYPVMVDNRGRIWNHEVDGVYPNEGDVYIQSGPIDFNNGNKDVAIRDLYPDMEALSDVTYELITQQFPNSTEYTWGPYDANLPTPTTGVQGKIIKLKVNFLKATSEHGIVRADIAPVGGTSR